MVLLDEGIMGYREVCIVFKCCFGPYSFFGAYGLVWGWGCFFFFRVLGFRDYGLGFFQAQGLGFRV